MRVVSKGPCLLVVLGVTIWGDPQSSRRLCEAETKGKDCRERSATRSNVDPMINEHPPFKGLNIRIPIIIPTNGERFS